MSVQAIVWVLEEAPISKPSHIPVLMALANEADSEGKGAFPSQRTMAWQTRKTERAVRKDLDAMAEEGLIRRGDQERAAYIAADRRPIVWDLALDCTRDMSKRPTKRPASGWDGKHRATDDVDRAEPEGTTGPPDTEPQVKTGGTTGPGGTGGSNRGELEGRTGGNHSSADPETYPRDDTHTGAAESEGDAEATAETSVCELSGEEINQMKRVIFTAVVERATGAVEIASSAQLYDLLDLGKQCRGLNLSIDDIEDALNRRINGKTEYPYRVARDQLKSLVSRTLDPSFAETAPKDDKYYRDEHGNPWLKLRPDARPCRGQSCTDWEGQRYVAVTQEERPDGSVRDVPAGGAFSCPVCKEAFKTLATA